MRVVCSAKIQGKWWILHRGDHENPADYFNTCLKIGKKRALVDAVLTATAASDVFTHEPDDEERDVNAQLAEVKKQPQETEKTSGE